MIKITVILTLAGVCLAVAQEVKPEIGTKAKKEVAATMTVTRCRAIVEGGAQCGNQADSGRLYCWKHHGAIRQMRETVDGVGDGAKSAWESTKTWSSNAWESTRGAFDGARVGLVKLLGGKDASKKKEAEK